MLDAFIIEQIKREERERSTDDRPVAQLPVPEPAPEPAQRDDRRPPGDDGGGGGGVVIIDYAGG
jgi:hypothetical protein